MSFENSVLERPLLHRQSEQKQRSFLPGTEGRIGLSTETQEGLLSRADTGRQNCRNGTATLGTRS